MLGDDGRNLKSFFAPLGLQWAGPTQKAKWNSYLMYQFMHNIVATYHNPSTFLIEYYPISFFKSPCFPSNDSFVVLAATWGILLLCEILKCILNTGQFFIGVLLCIIVCSTCAFIDDTSCSWWLASSPLWLLTVGGTLVHSSVLSSWSSSGVVVDKKSKLLLLLLLYSHAMIMITIRKSRASSPLFIPHYTNNSGL